MPRVLTAARVTVAPEHAGEYLELIHQLAAIGEERGQHLWVFRSMAHPGMFLEFSESRTELTHRSRASRTDLEGRLERRLREICTYAPGAWDLWEEVPEPDPAPGNEEY